jgi:phage terminase small subunit
MARDLTAKQRAFVEAYLSNGRNGAEAYRTAYDTKSSPQRSGEMAHELLANPKISPIVAAAEQQAEQRTVLALHKHGLTREALVEDVIAVIQDAKKAGERMTMLHGVKLAAQLGGLLVEKREVRQIRSLRDLTEEELAAIEADASKTEGDGR